MTTTQPMYDAYLLRTWREVTDELASPTHYYLLEELFGARQRWVFDDPTDFYTHLRAITESSAQLEPRKAEV
jgi:hypothetical protein